MASLIGNTPNAFVDRRSHSGEGRNNGVERRQFTDARDSFRPEVSELAEAIDQYKLCHRRRFITYDELYNVIVSLGYHK